MVVCVLKQHLVTHLPTTVTISILCEENGEGGLSTATNTAADTAAPV